MNTLLSLYNPPPSTREIAADIKNFSPHELQATLQLLGDITTKLYHYYLITNNIAPWVTANRFQDQNFIREFDDTLQLDYLRKLTRGKFHLTMEHHLSPFDESVENAVPAERNIYSIICFFRKLVFYSTCFAALEKEESAKLEISKAENKKDKKMKKSKWHKLYTANKHFRSMKDKKDTIFNELLIEAEEIFNAYRTFLPACKKTAHSFRKRFVRILNRRSYKL